MSVVVVSETFDGFRAQIEAMGLPHGIANSLVAKIDAAQRQFNRGNNDTAANTLRALIRAVDAQDGKKIPSAQAAQIRESAQLIITHLR